MSYIEREALRDALYEADAITMKGAAIINQFPAADVAPVVHGRWREDTDPADGDLRCTHCGIAWPKCVQKQIEEQGIWTLQTLFKYCPSCGAKMDKEAENERND